MTMLSDAECVNMPFIDVGQIQTYKYSLIDTASEFRIYKVLTGLLVDAESPNELAKYQEALLAFLISIDHIPEIPGFQSNILEDPIVAAHVKMAINGQSIYLESEV